MNIAHIQIFPRDALITYNSEGKGPLSVEPLFTIMMPTGGRCWRPYPELPAGEVEGRASESRGEKLSHLLPAGGGRRG